VSVTVTASAVRVVVPVTAVSSVFVKVDSSVVVSRVSTIEVRVNVSTASEVTVTVGMVSSDEQNSVADGTASSPSTTGEMSSHSVSTARESRSEVMDVRMVMRISDSGPNVDLLVPRVERETWVSTRLNGRASIYTCPRRHSAANHLGGAQYG
jgi:hypothetical protein